MTGETSAAVDCETFVASWPGVLVEMKDFVDLWFLAMQKKHRVATLRIFISRTLVPQSQLQPHMREFKASLSRIPDCRIELLATLETAHRIEIEYRR